MIVFGITLFVLGMIALPFEIKYKKVHGEVPKERKRMHFIVLFIASVIITLILKLFVLKDTGRKSPTQIVATMGGTPRQSSSSSPEDLLARKEESAKAAEERRLPQIADTEQRKEFEAKREAMQQEAKARHEETRRKMEEQRAEAQRLRNLALEERDRQREERKAKFEALRFKSEQMSEMRKADFFEPPPGDATPEQAAIDEKIIAANAELQQMVAEKKRLEEQKDAASAAMKELRKASPIDRAKMAEATKSFSESIKGVVALGRPIMEKRNEVTRLLDERYKLAE